MAKDELTTTPTPTRVEIPFNVLHVGVCATCCALVGVFPPHTGEGYERGRRVDKRCWHCGGPIFYWGVLT